MVVGAGGVLVDVLGDRAVALAPFDRRRAEHLLDRLAVRSLLDGVRGAGPVDIDAVVDALVCLSNLALELGDRINALDINPLRCGPWGVLAVDVFVETRPPAVEAPRERT